MCFQGSWSYPIVRDSWRSFSLRTLIGPFSTAITPSWREHSASGVWILGTEPGKASLEPCKQVAEL